MKRGFRFFGLSLVLLVVILGMFFVMADSASLAPSTASAGDTVSMLWFNVSNSSGNTSSNNLTSITINNTGTATGFNITNITVSNGTVYYNDSFGSFPGDGVVVYIGRISNSTNVNGWNFTINFTLNSSATYGATLQANVTSTSKEANVTHDTAPFNSTTVTVTESTDPTASASCTSNVVYVGEAFPCSCSGTDSGATASGIASTSGSSTSPDGTSIPQTIGVFTYTCSVTDNAGNSASSSVTYTVVNAGGGGDGTPSLPKNIHQWAKIIPGEVTIMTDFDPETGVKQIEVTVTNEANNVKVTVIKHEGKPAEVTIEKDGKVYQYIQIDAQNLNEELDTATVQFKVRKTWVTNNGLEMGDIAVYRFNEASQTWQELTTEYVGEDSDYYYYDVELTSFSYFAISEKSDVVEEEEDEDRGPFDGVSDEGGSLTWLWILIALIVLIAIGWQAKTKQKKKK